MYRCTPHQAATVKSTNTSMITNKNTNATYLQVVQQVADEEVHGVAQLAKGAVGRQTGPRHPQPLQGVGHHSHLQPTNQPTDQASAA
jgi:hypothetical protein